MKDILGILSCDLQQHFYKADHVYYRIFILLKIYPYNNVTLLTMRFHKLSLLTSPSIIFMSRKTSFLSSRTYFSVLSRRRLDSPIYKTRLIPARRVAPEKLAHFSSTPVIIEYPTHVHISQDQSSFSRLSIGARAISPRRETEKLRKKKRNFRPEKKSICVRALREATLQGVSIRYRSKAELV